MPLKTQFSRLTEEFGKICEYENSFTGKKKLFLRPPDS